MQPKLSGKKWFKFKDFYVYIHKLFEWVRVLRKSFKHNKYLWLSQILTQLKDHLPTGVSPRYWRKVHHQCVFYCLGLCVVYTLGFLREMGMPTTSQVCFVPRFSPLPSLSLRRETRQGKKETLGTSLMVSQFLLGVFLYYREIVN